MVRSSFHEILPQVLAVSVKNIVLIGRNKVLCTQIIESMTFFEQIFEESSAFYCFNKYFNFIFVLNFQ